MKILFIRFLKYFLERIFIVIPESIVRMYFFWVFFQKRTGWEKSLDTHQIVDDVYTLLPKEFLLNWEHEQEVEYTYIHETGGEERHVEVKHPDYSS